MEDMLSLDVIPTPVEHFLAERLDDDILLGHPGLAKTIRLNQTASLIWGLCDGQRTDRTDGHTAVGKLSR